MAALFFDIDGTLISELTGKIPESAREAMRKAKDNGHKLFINTGRTLCSLPPAIKAFGFDGLLCGCGTYLLYQDQVLLESAIPFERGRELIDAMESCCVEGFLEGTEDIYFSSRVYRFEQLESTRRYMAGLGLGRESWLERKDFQYDKMLVYIDDKSDKERFFQLLRPDIEPIDRGGGMYECIQKEFSKATAIQYMQEYLGLDQDDIYVVGDSSNDLSMFQYAAHGIAMGAHDAVLDPYTEYVTDTVENDGIKKALLHYRLISED